MTSPLRADPAFAGLVASARRRAVEAGKIRQPRRRHRFVSPLPPDAQAIVAEWLRDGGRADAVAQLALEDPDLAAE